MVRARKSFKETLTAGVSVLPNERDWNLVEKLSEAPSESCGRAFRYTTIACEIVVFAFVGWIIGPFIFGPGGDVIGMFVGILVGTLMMFLTLLYIAGVFGRRSTQTNQRRTRTSTSGEN